MKKLRMLSLVSLVLVVGCVKGVPFEPEMCLFEVGQSISREQLELCPPPIEIRRHR